MMLKQHILGFYMFFGDNLKRLRRDKGWTQSQLSKAADLKMTHIPRLENDTADPKLSTIYKLINGLGCTADTLLMDKEKVGADGLVKAAIERVESLPEVDKRILINVIDKYCIAVGMEKSFSNEKKPLLRVWTEAPDSMLSAEEIASIDP